LPIGFQGLHHRGGLFVGGGIILLEPHNGLKPLLQIAQLAAERHEEPKWIGVAGVAGKQGGGFFKVFDGLGEVVVLPRHGTRFD